MNKKNIEHHYGYLNQLWKGTQINLLNDSKVYTPTASLQIEKNS